MPPSVPRVGTGSAIASSSTTNRNETRGADIATRAVLVAISALAPTASWFVVRLLAGRFLSNISAGLAAFCAAWIALYPLSRLNRSVPAWSHWARGGFVLLTFWLLMLFSR